MAAFDPYAISPDFKQQSNDVMTAWQRAVANLNYNKTNTLSKYGFNNEGDLTDAGQSYNGYGTTTGTAVGGGLTGVTNFSDFAGKDNKTGYGGFRDELNAETNALDLADNGPDRGFSGGLANQAKAAAQQRVAASQNQFQQNYNQFAGGFNQAGADTTGNTNLALSGINQAQGEYKANEALWQSSLPVSPAYTPGVSGGGRTPVNVAASFGYSVNTNVLNNQKGVTFKGTAPKPVVSHGGHAPR